MISPAIRQALFFEIHRSIEEAARSCVAGMLAPDEVTPEYPPNAELTQAERAALRTLTVSPEARAALEKLAADACGSTFFHLFAVMDGVTDPDAGAGHWPGVTLEAKQEDDEDEEMLHDEFLESYQDYRARR
jgi:hypothetical protein